MLLSAPIQVLVELLRTQQVPQLLQACEGAKLVLLLAEIDPAKQRQQLLDARSRAPAAHEARQARADLVETDPVAAVVAAGRAGGHLAVFENFGDLLGEISGKQARDASQIGQIGGFKTGSSNIVPLELNQAQSAGDGWKLLGDILGGLGSVGVSAGIGGANPLSSLFAPKAAVAGANVARSAVPVSLASIGGGALGVT